MKSRFLPALLAAALVGLGLSPCEAQTRSNRDGASVVIPGGRMRPNSELKKLIDAGLYEITWIETRFTPAMRATETVFRRCYTPQDVARSSNPVMPAEQEKQCKTKGSMIGSDMTFDTDCPENGGTAYHRVRFEFCPDGYCGHYSYVPAGKEGILDNIVLMVKVADKCQ